MSNTPPTHVATQQNARPPMPLDEFKLQLARDYQKQITNYFNGDTEKAMKFMSAVVYSVQKTPKLMECDRTSLLHSFMSAAEFQLYPSSVAGEAYVIPYKGKAQFQLGYQGIITLLWRAGINVQSQIVRETDEFEYQEGLQPKLFHRYDPFRGERGEAIGVYAVAAVENGMTQHKVMSKDEVMKFKEFSQAKDSQYSPWADGNDPELWMWKKTCIKQLAKTLPKTEVLQKAFAEDNEESTVPKKHTQDLAGPAVGRALHDPASMRPSESEASQEVPGSDDVNQENIGDLQPR